MLTVAANSGMSSRAKVLAGLLTVLLLLGLGVALAMADALPVLGGRTTNAGANADTNAPERLGAGDSVPGASTVPAEAIQAEWGGPAVHLDWKGIEYARAETTFIGTRIAAPGDRVERTLLITNAGPGDGIAAVTLDASELVPAGATNTRFSDDVLLFWSIDGVAGQEIFTALKTTDRQTVAEVAVERGATIPVTFGFAVDADTETSRALSSPSAELSFDVGVNLTGDTEQPPLVVTGATGAVLLVAIAVALVLVGWFVIAAARRRPREERAEIHE